MMREVTIDHVKHVEFSADLARLLGYESSVRYDVRTAKYSKFPPKLETFSRFMSTAMRWSTWLWEILWLRRFVSWT